MKLSIRKVFWGCAAFVLLGQAAFFLQNRLSQPVFSSYPLQEAPPYVVALDAGHGGFDTGANYGKWKEVEICESTVDELFRLLEQNPSFLPVRTRNNGEGARISERVEQAVQAHASLLVSIHINLDPSNTQSHGFECFPTPPGRKWSDKSMQFAQLVAQGMGESGHRLRGSNGVRFAYYSGKRKLIVDAEDTRERTLKSFGILEEAMCPAILIEQCFLSNQNDRDQWASEDGCERAAEIYYKAICSYFSVDETPQPQPDPVKEAW